MHVWPFYLIITSISVLVARLWLVTIPDYREGNWDGPSTFMTWFGCWLIVYGVALVVMLPFMITFK